MSRKYFKFSNFKLFKNHKLLNEDIDLYKDIDPFDEEDWGETDSLFFDDEINMEFDWSKNRKSFNGWAVRGNLHNKKFMNYLKLKYNDNSDILIGYEIRERIIKYDKFL